MAIRSKPNAPPTNFATLHSGGTVGSLQNAAQGLNFDLCEVYTAATNILD